MIYKLWPLVCYRESSQKSTCSFWYQVEINAIKGIILIHWLLRLLLPHAITSTFRFCTYNFLYLNILFGIAAPGWDLWLSAHITRCYLFAKKFWNACQAVHTWRIWLHGTQVDLHSYPYYSGSPYCKWFMNSDLHYTCRSSRYNSGHHPSSYYIDDPPVSQSRIGRYGEERSTIIRHPEPRHDEIDTKRYPEPRLAHESRHNTGKHLDRGYIQEQSLSIERSPEEAGLSRGRRFLPAGGYGTDLGSDFRSRSPVEYSAERQQVRFDPFTGEPYKFDPFTGQPIRPESNHRRSGSLYWLDGWSGTEHAR